MRMDGASFFLTGMQRSGTTLLEKMIGAPPEISALSQPFPFLFLELKRAFLASLGHGDDPYPLGTLFREERYRTGDFEAFLARHTLEAETVRRVFRRMEGFSGQYTKVSGERLEAALRDFPEGEPAAGIAHLYRALSDRPDARWFGGKETVCEELLPYLLDRGFSCAVIVRDVRDVLTSLNHGHGPRFGGRHKPTLFNVRSWRRSVRFALELDDAPGFGWLRYEDLVVDPEDSLATLAPKLGMPPGLWAGEPREMTDAAGDRWPGNSSHGSQRGVSRSSVGRHEDLLPGEVRRFAEAACHRELLRLGYPVSIEPGEAETILREFREPYEIDRPGLMHYVTDRREIDAEIERVRAGETTGATE